MERALGMALVAATMWLLALATASTRRSGPRLAWGVAAVAVIFVTAPAALFLLYES